MATFITPDYVLNKLKRRDGETERDHCSRLSDLMNDKSEDPMVRNAASYLLYKITSCD